MANEIKIKVGTRVEEEEAKKLDPRSLGVTGPTPKGGDVEGQSWEELVACPWCGAGNWIWVDPWENAYRCWNCAGVFYY